ncbi:hypothetical protein Tco_0581648 [Tanacetum coccineum]
MNKKSYSFDLDTFRNILQICPKIPRQHFIDTLFEEDIFTFMRELGYSRTIKLLYDVKCIKSKTRSPERTSTYTTQDSPRSSSTTSCHKINRSIPRRNKVDWHMVTDDPILTTIRFIPQNKVVEKYGAILPNYLTTQAMKESEAYKTHHALATRKVQPKPKYVRRSSRTKTDDVPKPSSRKRVKATAKVANGSGAYEGTGVKPGVPDVPTYRSDDEEEIPWKLSDEDDDDDQCVPDDDQGNDNDSEQTASDTKGDDFVHPKFTSHDTEERHDEEDKDKESFDPRVQTPSNYEPSDDEANGDLPQSGYVEEEEVNVEQTFEANINLEGRDTEMTDAPKTTQVIEDTHVTLTPVNLEVSKILLRIEKLVNEQLESEVLIRSSHEAKSTHAIAANLSELELKKILIDKMESNKSIDRSDEQKNLYKALVDAYAVDKDLLDAYGDTITIKRRRDEAYDNKEPSVGTDRGSKRRRAGKEPESSSAPKETTSKSTGKLTKGSKSRHQSAGQSAPAKEPIHSEDDFKEPTHQEFETEVNDDQPEDEIHPSHDWQEDPRESFDELMDTPLDFSAFVMNQLKVDTLTPELLDGPTFELMKGTCKSLVKLKYFFEEVYKATTEQLDWTNPEGQQYPHDLRKPLPLISNTRGRQVIPFDHFINKDLAYLSGGVSSQKIIAVTKLQIIEWHGYKHLDWITVRRDDDKLYSFKEGDLKRLQLQDIEDMLILLVQGKMSNFKIEEHLAFTYSSPRGFIYQNKDKKNRLMRLDELHKFSDGTLDYVRTALDDRLKGIRMEYLPKTIWRQSNRERATDMIQAIDKRLKSRRIMRSLEKFVGGRPYEGDFRLIQSTI